MARAFDNIKDITDAKEIWKFGVRVEHLWTGGSGKNEHLEFLIIDKQGDKIQVHLPNDILTTWKSKLNEGTTYVMKNFRVKPNDFKVKFCDHPWKLVMVDGVGASDVTPKQMLDIPHYKLNFKSFEEINKGKFQDDLLVDIIGAVHEVAPARVNPGPKKYPTSFTLADAKMNILTCTLWDNFGKQFLEKYNQHGDNGPFIVIIKHAKIKEAQGAFDLAISNAWIGTKLILDQDFPEIKDFRATLPGDFVAQTQSQLVNAGSKFSSQMSQGSQYSTGERYCFQAPATILSKLPLLPEDEIVTTVATTEKILIGTDGWFYLSCNQCNKKMVTDSPPLKCKLEHITEDPPTKFKLELEVSHQNSKFKFLFWDRDCTMLIGYNASQLRSIMIQVGEFSKDEYPLHLDNMLRKECAFKVKIQGRQTASVLNFKDDQEIIDHVKIQFPSDNNLEVSKCTNLPASVGESSKSFGANGNEMSQDTSIPTQDISATAESSPETRKMHTPAKRTVPHDGKDEPTSAKLSTNKVIGNIKKEPLPTQKLKI